MRTLNTVVRTSAALLLLGVWMPVYAAVELDTCGQAISGNAKLAVTTLDCSSYVDGPALKIGGTLFLEGGIITGNPGFDVVECTGDCTIVGPGTVTGGKFGIVSPKSISIESGVIVSFNAAGGVLATSNAFVEDSTIRNNAVGGVDSIDGRAVVKNSAVVDNDGTGVVAEKNIHLRDSVVSSNDSLGIWSSEGRVVARGCDVSDNGGEGIAAETTARISNSTVSRNGTAGINVPGRGIVVRNSTVSDNGWHGVIDAFFGTVKIKDSAITGNGIGDLVTNRPGVFGEIVKIVRSDVSGNAWDGVAADRARIVDSTIIANGIEGVWSSPGPLRALRVEVRDNGRSGLWVGIDCKLQVTDSTVTGNGTAPECGVSQTCADVASCAEPNLYGSTVCASSYDVNSGFPGTSWGICAAD